MAALQESTVAAQTRVSRRMAHRVLSGIPGHAFDSTLPLRRRFEVFQRTLRLEHPIHPFSPIEPKVLILRAGVLRMRLWSGLRLGYSRYLSVSIMKPFGSELAYRLAPP